MADKNKFWISDADKEWIHDSFSWLIQVYGYPSGNLKPIQLTDEFFPETLSSKTIDVNALITDLCGILGLEKKKFTYDFVDDSRDIEGMPYEIQGDPFECEMDVETIPEGYLYHIILAKTLLNHPGRLLLNLIIETVKARQYENNISFEDIIEKDLLAYNISIYIGFGVLLYKNLIEQGKSSDGLFWDKKWSYSSIIPVPVMAYALALFCNLTDEKDPAWKKELKPDLLKEYDKAVDYIQQTGNPLFNKQELTARKLYKDGQGYYDQNNFKKAIEEFQKALFATSDMYLKMDLYNSIGYANLRIQEYEKSIPNFQKALEINPGYGYANDNLGFAFIMSDDLETGKFYLHTALKTDNNDDAYSYRNFALYHQKRKEFEQAEDYFQKAFSSINIPVDLLEYFYARFLFENGEKEKGMGYLNIAVEKGEPEAIQLMNTINNTK